MADMVKDRMVEESLSMYVSVVVPTYNRKESLARCLSALSTQTVNESMYEIIVVDDCSTDDTRIYVEDLRKSRSNLIYIHHSQNRGLAATRNSGIAAARGDIVICLDNDNVPAQQFVEAHLRYHNRNGDEHIAVVGNVRFASECIADSNFGRYLQSRYLGCRSPLDRARLDYSNLPPNNFAGLNHSARRSDFVAVGMFDTSFRYYGGEDESMGYCFRKRGIRIIFGEDARSLHYDEVSLLRYKSKIMETVREGLPIILAKIPDYVEGTRIRYLTSINRNRDSLKRIVVKAVVRSVLNPIVVSLLEQWALLTDHVPQLYCHCLYRPLVAGWIVQAQRSSLRGVKLVSYGDE